MYIYNLGKIFDLISVYQKYYNESKICVSNMEWLDKGELLDEYLPFFMIIKVVP